VDRGRSVIATVALAALHKLMGQLPGGVVCSGEAVRSGPIWWTTRRRRHPPAVASQADTSVPGPAGDTPGRRSARPDDRSQVVAPAGHRVRSRRDCQQSRQCRRSRTGCCLGCQQHAAAAHEPATARRTPGSNADACRFLVAMHVRCGPILLPPRCHEDQKARPPSGDQAPDLHLLVAGAGFEPATSGL
jgi:hypothetical protein